MLVLSADGSYTAYSKEYDEHYHSTKDGALSESLNKHIIPAFKLQSHKKTLNILDICFGLGFNTLATLYYAKKIGYRGVVNIYSPELDERLLLSLKDFIYPKELEPFKSILYSLVEDGLYRDDSVNIELFVGDAREYIKGLKDIDIVYQDAFSPKTNPMLWTQEYFSDIKKLIKNDGIITTYSTALATRLALYQNLFKIFLNQGESFRNATIASLSKIDGFKEVDMAHKLKCNPDAKALRD
ncbi:MAG: MnmC family methyltransferase [Sulfurimonas sp.]